MLALIPTSQWTPAAAAHVLNRAAFGGHPDAIARFHAMGPRDAVESLVSAEEDLDLFPPPPLASPQQNASALRSLRDATPLERTSLRRQIRRTQHRELASLRHWWLDRMRHSPHPLREKTTLLWHSHWATSAAKVRSPWLLRQQNETLRARSLGPFVELATSMTRDPAMMRYLDLHLSTASNPNENFARELLELFTLGEGHYSEEDIRELARALAGRRINPRTATSFLSKKHADTKRKTILGRSGTFPGDEAITHVATSPRCAEFISSRLWTHLAGTPPPPALAASLAATYRDQGLRTASLLRTILLSEEFHAPPIVRRQIKSPVQWLVQSCKILDTPLPPPATCDRILSRLGQTLFAPPSVKGWDEGTAWINSSTLLLRYNTAETLLPPPRSPSWQSIAPPHLPPDQLCDSLAWRLFQDPLPDDLRQRAMTFLAESDDTPAARRELAALLMKTPEFQLS
jgi:uncharacterized protein (DUF1800 family)